MQLEIHYYNHVLHSPQSMTGEATTVKKPSENSPIKRAKRRRCERKQTPQNRVSATKRRNWEKTVEDASLPWAQGVGGSNPLAPSISVLLNQWGTSDSGLTGLFCTSENERESTLQEAIASAPITVRSNFCSGTPMAPARTWVLRLDSPLSQDEFSVSKPCPHHMVSRKSLGGFQFLPSTPVKHKYRPTEASSVTPELLFLAVRKLYRDHSTPLFPPSALRIPIRQPSWELPAADPLGQRPMLAKSVVFGESE